MGVAAMENQLPNQQLAKQPMDVLAKQPVDVVTGYALKQGALPGAFRWSPDQMMSEQDYVAIFQTIPLPLFLCQLDGTILDVNEQFLLFTGYARAELLAHPIEEFALSPHPELCQEFLREIAATHEARTQTMTIRSATGAEKAVDVIGKLVTLSQGERIVCMFYDRTKQQETEMALMRERNFNKTILQAEDLLVVVLNTLGQVLRFNAACERLTGYTTEEVRGACLWDLLSPPEERETLKRLFHRLVHQRVGIHYEGEWRTKAGERRLISWSSTITNNGKHQRECVVVSGLDITERRRTEQKLQHQLERLSELRRIQMVISESHDQSMALALLVNHVTRLLDVDAAAVLLYDRARGVFEYAAGQGFRSTAIRWCRMRIGEGYPGRAALERRTLVVPDIMQDKTPCVRISLLRREDMVSYCGVPLINKGEIKGVLEVFHRSVFPFHWEWMNFLETLAAHAAVVIANTELVDNLRASREELIRAYDDTIQGWARALELRDAETQGHSHRVTEMTIKLARFIGYPEAELVHLRRGALLHDIGKMGIPDSILLKPGPLTPEEEAIMRRHPVYAYEMLSGIPFLRPALDIPYCHHEKWDGSGYPRQLQGTEIPLGARIFSIIDVCDALCSDRPYRAGWPFERAQEYIRSQSGKAFDPHLVEAFLQLFERKLGDKRWEEMIG